MIMQNDASDPTQEDSSEGSWRMTEDGGTLSVIAVLQQPCAYLIRRTGVPGARPAHVFVNVDGEYLMTKRQSVRTRLSLAEDSSVLVIGSRIFLEGDAYGANGGTSLRGTYARVPGVLPDGEVPWRLRAAPRDHNESKGNLPVVANMGDPRLVRVGVGLDAHDRPGWVHLEVDGRRLRASEEAGPAMLLRGATVDVEARDVSVSVRQGAQQIPEEFLGRAQYFALHIPGGSAA